uniref:FA complementation group C n=1 Tax=Salarias fasciatus TaxID=181472 RepID=A0A672GD10_SALFA
LHAAESVLDVQGMQFWLDKAVAWSQADGPDSQRDTCLHLSRLRDFLQQLLTHIHNMVTETMQRLPLLGQFLGYLCWNPFVTADGSSRGLLLQCVLGLHSEHPSSAVERKANQWIRVGRGSNYQCLHTQEDEFAIQVFMKHVILFIFRLKCISSCSCSCDVVLATSDACVPLVTYPEASPVVSALLQRPVTCVKETLSEDFLEALSSSHTALNVTYYTLHYTLASTVSPLRSLPFKMSFFFGLLRLAVIYEMKGSALGSDAAEEKKSCFVLFQMSVPLKAFFPQSPPSLLAPLLTLPSGQWFNHSACVNAASRLRRCSSSLPCRGRHAVFEAWFLLVQCAHWVQVAVQLLATSGPEDCGLLLWLLTFYHHPTDRWHHRAVQAGEAWDHLLAVFVASPHPAPADRLRSLVALLSPRARNPPPLAPSLTISLLVNFAVFCQLPLSASAGILQTVRKRLVCCLTLTNTLPTPEYLSVRLLIFTSFNYRVAEESITGSHHFLKAFPNCLL